MQYWEHNVSIISHLLFIRDLTDTGQHYDIIPLAMGQSRNRPVSNIGTRKEYQYYLWLLCYESLWELTWWLGNRWKAKTKAMCILNVALRESDANMLQEKLVKYFNA